MCVCVCVCVCTWVCSVCIDTFVNGDDDTRIPWQEEDDYFKNKKNQ